MPFLSLTLNNFRNLKNDTINLLSKEIYFIGENGQGKSNLLEAVYMSSYASSFRTRNENEIIKNGENFYSVKGFFKEDNEKTDTVTVSYSEGKKNRKELQKNYRPKRTYKYNSVCSFLPR